MIDWYKNKMSSLLNAYSYALDTGEESVAKRSMESYTHYEQLLNIFEKGE